MALVRARVVSALALMAVFAGALAPVRCLAEDSSQLPAKATKELSPELLSLLQQKHMPKHSPILVRIFKEESELEVWKQDTTGHFQLVKTYPICRWSGDLGPKLHEGDRQAPEGFYTITAELMNPNSNYYLAINTGFPNSFDKANDRDGSFLMVHGDCWSSGCYAMTDEQMGEIYSLARVSFLSQPSFQIQAYPFRLTPANLARHRTNPNMDFWKMLKIGNDHFEATHIAPKVDVCDRHYVFDAYQLPNSSQPLVFDPTGKNNTTCESATEWISTVAAKCHPSPGPTTMGRWQVIFLAPCSNRSPPHKRKSPRPLQQAPGAARIQPQPGRLPRRQQSPRRRARLAALRDSQSLVE